MLSRLIVLAIISLLFQACGQGSQDETFYGPTPKKIERSEMPLEQRLFLMDQFKVECEDPNRCSREATVGIIIFADAQESFCSGTIIDQNHILTNHHCVRDLYADGKDCSTRLVAKNANGEVAQCDEIIAPFSEDLGLNDAVTSRFSRDAAIIKLKRPMRSSLNITQKFQFSNSQSAHILAVNPPAQGSLVAKMQVKDCHATQNTAVFPSFQGQSSSFVALFDCNNNPRSGNSGSLIVNSQNQPFGLFAWKYGVAQKKVPGLANTRNFAPEEKIDFNVGVNLNCLDFSGASSSLNWNHCTNHNLSGLDLIDIYSGRS